MLGDAELRGEITSAIFCRIADHDNFATRIALPAGNMGHFCPSSGPENSYSQLICHTLNLQIQPAACRRSL